MTIRTLGKSLWLGPIAFSLLIGLGAVLYTTVSGPDGNAGSIDLVIEPGM